MEQNLTFAEDESQKYLVFQPISRYFQIICKTIEIFSWRLKGMSEENIKTPSTPENSFAQKT